MPHFLPTASVALRHVLPLLCVLAGFCAPMAVAAAPSGLVTEEDTLIRGARECTRNMPIQEKKYNIPQHLMMAIASNESGRYHTGLKAVVPWPWTVNAEGKGYYFASKQEAISAVRRFQGEGMKSIDVGCMQVNLKHHPNAFTSLQNAFDPEANVAYAARFLRTNYESTKSWIKAVAHYHSQTPKYGTPYAQNIYKRWKFVLERGGNTPEAAMAAVGSAATTQELASLQAAISAPRPAARPRSGTQVSATTAAQTRADAIRRDRPQMKVIRVYNEQPQLQVVNSLGDAGVLRMERGVKVASGGSTPQSAVGARLSTGERAEVSAVSNMIIQDIADAQNAYGSTSNERGVSVSRGQFAPRATAQAHTNIASGDDGDFVMRR